MVGWNPLDQRMCSMVGEFAGLRAGEDGLRQSIHYIVLRSYTPGSLPSNGVRSGIGANNQPIETTRLALVPYSVHEEFSSLYIFSARRRCSLCPNQWVVCPNTSIGSVWTILIFAAHSADLCKTLISVLSNSTTFRVVLRWSAKQKE